MRVISKVQNIKINFKLPIHIETKVKPSADSHSDSGYIIPLMPTCLSVASMIRSPSSPLPSSFNFAQFPLYNCYKQSSFKQFSLSRWDLTLTHRLKFVFNSFQSLSHVWLFVTPWCSACQASLSITNSWSLLKLMSIASVMPSNHLILCRPLLLLPSVFPSIRVFSNESVLCMRWPKYWSFSFSISPSNEYSGLISFRTRWSPRDSQENSPTPQFKICLQFLYNRKPTVDRPMFNN